MPAVAVTPITCDLLDPKRIADEIAAFGYPIDRIRMPVGDYGSQTKAGSWLVERKEANDLLASLGSDRLWSQVLRLVEACDHAFLLPEGELHPTGDGKVRLSRGRSEWSFMAVYHSLIELEMAGIHVMPFVNPRYTAKAITQVHESLNNGFKYLKERNRRPLTLENKHSPARRFMGPMVGDVTLSRLAEKYPNLWSLFNAAMNEPDEVTRIYGLGATTVKKLRDLLVKKI